MAKDLVAAAPARAARSERTPRRTEGTGGTAELDPIIHERTRLGIVSALAVNDVLTFKQLKQLLGSSDGNLSVHARKLEDAGQLECRKSFQGRMPKTEYRLTPRGRRALERYLDHMEALIRAARTR